MADVHTDDKKDRQALLHGVLGVCNVVGDSLVGLETLFALAVLASITSTAGTTMVSMK